MRLLRFSFFLALLLPVAALQAQANLPAGSSRYTILQGEKAIGSTDFTVSPTPAGYTIDSRGEMHLSKVSYSFTNEQHLDHMLNLVSDQITGTVNGKPVTFAIHSDPSGREFHIDVTANGQTSQNTIDRHQHLALLPDLDSAGYMLLTCIGLEDPKISWVLIPKETGLLVPSVYTRDADVRGRLNGRETQVQHTTVTVSARNAITVELFHTSDGGLLEADLPEQNFFVVRDGFKLINRPKFAPPRSPEANMPPPKPGNGQQYSAPQDTPPPQTQQQ